MLINGTGCWRFASPSLALPDAGVRAPRAPSSPSFRYGAVEFRGRRGRRARSSSAGRPGRVPPPSRPPSRRVPVPRLGTKFPGRGSLRRPAFPVTKITLSGRTQLLAGTDRRVVFLSGPFRAVMDAADLVLHKILYQGDRVIDADTTVLLVVPDACCGALIGKGGAIIKSLAQASKAGITVSHPRICYGFNDRLVRITGHLDNQLQAIFLILSELLDDVQYKSSYASVGFPRYHGSTVGRDGDGQDEHVERYHSRPDTPVGSPDVDDSRDGEGTLIIGVANEYVGAIIGRGGRAIKEIEQATGAWIRVFKGELLPGTREREVEINGTREAVDAAEAMIAEHISYAMDRRGGKQGGERRRPSLR